MNLPNSAFTGSGAQVMAYNKDFDNLFFEDLFENSTAMSVVTDKNGMLVKVNKRALDILIDQDHDIGNVIGRNILEFIH